MRRLRPPSGCQWRPLVIEGAVGATSIEDLVKKLNKPRAVLDDGACGVVDSTINTVSPLPEADDVIIDGRQLSLPR